MKLLDDIFIPFSERSDTDLFDVWPSVACSGVMSSTEIQLGADVSDGDVLHNVDTGECILISKVSDGSCRVVRGFGGTRAKKIVNGSRFTHVGVCA